MAHSAEHRAEMHLLGVERRAQGKPRWERTVDIRAFLHNDYDSDPAVNAYHKIQNVVEVLTANLGDLLDPSPDNSKYDFEFEQLLEEMKDRTIDGLRADENLDHTVEYYLHDVFDVLDYNSIWAGDGMTKVEQLHEPSEQTAPGL
jgi:hypothetical protein